MLLRRACSAHGVLAGVSTCLTSSQPSGAAATKPLRCTRCAHVYDPVRDGNGLAFEDLPDTWTCPICGAPKYVYAKQLNGEYAHVEDSHQDANVMSEAYLRDRYQQGLVHAENL